MKKTVLMTVAAAAFASSAHAGSLSADFRIDNDSTSYNDAAINDGGQQGNSKFRVQTGRLDFKGILNEDVSYRVRLRFDKDRTLGINKRDNVDSAVDYAYVANKFSDMFTLTLGKIATEMGGFEGNTAGPELYLTSASYAGTGLLGGSKGTATASLKSILLYVTGAQAGFTFAETQQIHLQAFNEEGATGLGYVGVTPGGAAANGDDASGPSAAFAQSKSMFGLVYRGGFMDKTFNVIASYHTENVGAKDNKVDLATLGFEYSLAGVTAQLDYDMNRFQVAGASVTPKQALDTVVLMVKYSMDEWTPSLKFATATEKMDAGSIAGVASDISNKYTDFGAALEYAPKKDQMFRYHVAYNNRSMTPDSNLAANSSRSLQQIIVGTRIMADILK